MLSVIILYGAAKDIVDFATTNFSVHQGCSDGRTTLGTVTHDTPIEVQFPDFRTPSRQISRFDVSIVATGVSNGETVKVYLLGTNTREEYYLGKLNRAGNGEQEWTSLRVPNRDRDRVHQIIKDNYGLISIKFVMENRYGSAEINYVSIFIDW